MDLIVSNFFLCLLKKQQHKTHKLSCIMFCAYHVQFTGVRDIGPPPSLSNLC